MPDFQVGEKVVHANYGLGEIIQLDVKFIHGRQMLCYMVRVRDMTIWVNADENSMSGLRRPTRESDFENLFVLLKSPGEALPVDVYERKKELLERMKDGKLASICAVIRDLTYFQNEKKLNFNDKNTIERAKELLLAEWTYSRSVTYQQANDELSLLLQAT
jgi:RNA polymerase-interacting CarD/CdnL/TRCF family regulator